MANCINRHNFLAVYLNAASDAVSSAWYYNASCACCGNLVQVLQLPPYLLIASMFAPLQSSTQE
jgi:hypothetical protein